MRQHLGIRVKPAVRISNLVLAVPLPVSVGRKPLGCSALTSSLLLCTAVSFLDFEVPVPVLVACFSYNLLNLNSCIVVIWNDAVL